MPPEDAPTPENNLMLRQMAGMRRDMAEVMATNARVIELLGRVGTRIDDLSARVDRRLGEIQSDMVLMENRIVTAIAEVRHIAARLDEAESDREPA